MNDARGVAIEGVDFFIRNQTMRLPFRYGSACLTASPILHVRLRARGGDGSRAFGVSGDILPPKWFDKTPEKDYRRNIRDLLEAARIGAQWFERLSGTERPVFGLWHECHTQITREATLAGLNGLTAGFGVSIIERAAIDAACRLEGLPYHEMLRRNRFGVEPDRVHPALAGVRPADVLPPEPLDRIAIRHTVGLGDPILESDVSEGDALDDGLPVSLEAWVREGRFRFFKVKITGNREHDLERLDRIAALLERAAPEEYRISLDGNEQFRHGVELQAWFATIRQRPRLRELLQRVLFVEQPIERAAALDPATAYAFRGLDDVPPIVIDESDDSLEAFARSVDLGYRGVSVKNCKGVFKGLLNAMLVAHLRRETGGEFILTAEDLANQPIVPLHQDLCAVTTLGLGHVERNGHHYGGTLAHLSPAECVAALSAHGDLYESHRRAGRWRIRDGLLCVASLHRGGFGLPTCPTSDALIPLEDWDYSMLGLED